MFPRSVTSRTNFSCIHHLWHCQAPRAHSQSIFVPEHRTVREEDIDLLNNYLSKYKSIFVVSGAGISTESGIPDYRSEGVGLYARSTYKPVQYKDFLKSENIRRRYWARNYVGWPRFSSVQPNSTHFAISHLETNEGIVSSVVTQNVDGLHMKAGSNNVIELHGTAYRVVCLGCEYTVDRHTFQRHLAALNPEVWAPEKSLRPDGDVEMRQEEVEGFIVPSCPACEGVLKPYIVFFGDNVPKERVEAVRNQVEWSEALLVLGTTLSVFSAYRIILQASELKKPIAIVNIGQTRGDQHACLKINAKCGDIIPKLCR